MPLSKHIFIVAGEESGDLHAANIVKEILHAHPTWKISAIGGQHLKNAGTELIEDLASYAITGFSEVIKNFFKIKNIFNKATHYLSKHRPDLVILVDYPGFNLRLAKYIKTHLNLKIFYYISPQIWVWKKNRINIIKKNIDHMGVIFPFEKQIYLDAGVPVSFVGNPVVKAVKVFKDQYPPPINANSKIIALLPGSRQHEIAHHLPVMVECAKLLQNKFADIKFVIPLAKNIPKRYLEKYLPPSFINYAIVDDSLQAIASSDCVIVASGTAALETACMLKPMCVVYKASLITVLMFKMLANVKYLSLPNILSKKFIVPELLQKEFTPVNLYKITLQLLTDQDFKNSMINDLENLSNLLSYEAMDCSVGAAIEKLL